MSPTYLVRATKIAARKVAGEMVILDAEDSSLYVLNAVGTAVWEAADGATPISSVVEAICHEYDVDAETAARDVDAFVAGLVAHRVLRVVDQPAVDREGRS